MELKGFDKLIELFIRRGGIHSMELKVEIEVDKCIVTILEVESIQWN